MSHASGGAYLEECIREAIFSGIVAHDFPYGAIPTLEIVDTGETQRWPAPIEPSQERRVLLVRPLFVRPAHFERAVAFDAAGTFDGERDHARVTSIWLQAAALLGPQALVNLFDQCCHRWAHQLAYGFVHRLSHGNNTSSNIAIDGRLLDFGADSALPSWANTATSCFHDPIDRRFDAIAQAMRSVSYYLGTHLGWEWARPQRLEKSLHACAEAFRQALVFETLRLCGLPNDVAMEVLTGPRRLMALATVGTVISEAQAERLDLLEPAPLGHVDWPMSQLWCGRPPACLDALRRLMNSLVGKGRRTDCEERHRHRSATRSELFKPHLRQDIFRLIGEDLDTRLKTDPSFIQRWIDDHIARHVLESSPAAQDASRLLLPFSDAGD